MNSLTFYELHKICRICLKNDLLVSIYSPTYLMALTPIVMIEKLQLFKSDDKLPKLLCQSCLYRLLDAYNLKQLAEASAERYREYLNNKSNFLSNDADSEHHFNSNFQTTIQPGAAKAMHDNVNANNMYSNLCDMNDIEIDVSSLTRSEAEESLSDVVFLNHNIQRNHEEVAKFVSHDNGSSQLENTKIIENNLVKKKGNRRSMKVHKVPKTCLECGKAFKYNSSLKAHKRVHSETKPFDCKFCGRQFKQPSNLFLHQRIHAADGGRRFQCELCAALFRTSSNLKAHQLTHSDECDFQCTQCEKKFKTLRALRRHQPIHKTVKDVGCRMCDKTFTKQSYLNTHMTVVHRGIKRYKCGECTKVFGSQANLRCHMRIHTGEKPFQCKQCGLKFNQSSALRRHIRKNCKSLEQAAEASSKSFLIPPGNELLAAQATNEYVMPQLANMNALPLTSDELVEVGINDNESNLAATAYDFTKEHILDFSTNHTAPQSSTLY